MRALRIAALAAVVLGALGGLAGAYPQFQLSRDKTCTGCHLSPAGGGLLNENGETVAEGLGTLEHSPKLFYGKLPTPAWLSLGGEVRAAAGYLQTPERVLAAFPMQLELFGAAQLPRGVSIHASFGTRPVNESNAGATRVWSREHFVMWRTDPGSPTGIFVRAGRFMPVFGLRFAEHAMYTRRFGGTPLYGDTYGLHAAYVSERLEAHLTGFIEEPLIQPVAHASGGAAYAELRLGAHTQVGGGGMLEVTDDDYKLRGAVTAKHYLQRPDLLFQVEAQVVNQRIDAGGAPVQLIGNLVVSRWLAPWLLLDVGLGHFDSNVRYRDLDRDAAEVNLHWFASSHIELVLNTRLELLALGSGGDSHGYALMQLHYRM
jgi:hypothetical protein